MHRVVIADTSCLILFSKIDFLSVLHALYNSVVITPEVANEFGETLPPWINIRTAKPENIYLFEKYNLGDGEITALALAIDLAGSTIILDDNKAKKIARSHNLDVTGSLGIIIKAKESGLILSVRSVLDKIKTTDFHLTAELELIILKVAKEL